MRGRIGMMAMALALLAWAPARAQTDAIEELGDPIEEAAPQPPPQQLFLSPSGQPFRAARNQAYPTPQWFAQADADRDGRLTRAEFRADAEAWFKVIDADGDGLVGMPEATRWEDDLVPELARNPGGAGGGRRGPPGRNELQTYSQGAAPYSLINEPHPIRGADTDLSFSVSLAEWRAAADRRFAVLDADGDGAVALTDLRLTLAQRTGLRGDRDDKPSRRRGPQ